MKNLRNLIVIIANCSLFLSNASTSKKSNAASTPTSSAPNSPIVQPAVGRQRSNAVTASEILACLNNLKN